MDKTDQYILEILNDSLALDRFWKYIKPCNDGCWYWIAGTSENGYGIFGYDISKVVRVHRLMFAISNGHLPDGVVRHTCDHKLCVNPSHILDGSQKDNIADMLERGRGRKKYQYAFCCNGHEYTPENTYINPKTLVRLCRQCIRDSNNRNYRKRHGKKHL